MACRIVPPNLSRVNSASPKPLINLVPLVRRCLQSAHSNNESNRMAGLVFVSSKLSSNPLTLYICGIKNKTMMQSSPINSALIPTINSLLPPGELNGLFLSRDLIFTVPCLVSILSQGTTFKPGTHILTGTAQKSCTITSIFTN
jgi:hypothetical protein